MSVRIRKDRKTIVCAAKSLPEEGDLYLDDHIQYVLAVEMKVLIPRNSNTRQEIWYFDNEQNGSVEYEKQFNKRV